MALQIPNYLQPGTYSTIIPNPTAPTTNGPPILAIVGQALQGPYTPALFSNPGDAQTTYGLASIANPLANAIQIAFENGATNVLGVNVEPDNNSSSQILQNVTTLPTSAYMPLPSTALDAVTGLPANTTGNVAGTFYIQDFNPIVPDPYENTTTAAAQQVFSSASSTSMLQYYADVNGTSVVPLANSNAVQVVVYTAEATSPPASSISQAHWNQLTNANSLVNAINSAYGSPVSAQILLLDTGTAYPPALNPVNAGGYNILNYIDLGQAISLASQTSGYRINGTTQLGGPSSVYGGVVDTYNYAFASAGNMVIRIASNTGGNQHAIYYGLFDSNSANASYAVNTQALGLTPIISNNNNPYRYDNNGTNGVITTGSFEKAIDLLQNARADIIVALNTSPAIQNYLKSHVTLMSSTAERNERIAFVSGPITEQYQTTILNATSLQGGVGAQRMVYVWPTGGFRYDSALKSTVALDGTYLACALAGIATSYDAATPLTHKQISGFTDVIQHFSNTGMNNIAQNGVLVIENNPTYGLWVRDGITCDPTSPETQEISVVRQLDYTAQALRDAMDSSIIATKITQSTLASVQSLTVSTMENLKSRNIVYGYKNVVARINPNDPRQIDLSLAVRPAYPCKYVQITIQVSSSLSGF